MKLYYIILGATVGSRHTEQHDVYFGIAPALENLAAELQKFWPEAGATLHIDAYMELRQIDGFDIHITEKSVQQSEMQLFFVNLGGYQHGHFGELHEQQLYAAPGLKGALQRAKSSDFFKEKSMRKAPSHVDDRYRISADADDAFAVEDILPKEVRTRYDIRLQPAAAPVENPYFVGYLRVDKLLNRKKQ